MKESTRIPFLAFAGCRVNLWLTVKSKKRVGSTGLPQPSQETLEGWSSGLMTCPSTQQRIVPILPAGRGYLAGAHQCDWSLIYRLFWLLFICWHWCVINENHWFLLRSKCINLIDEYGLRLRGGQYFSPWRNEVLMSGYIGCQLMFLAYIEFCPQNSLKICVHYLF